MAKRGKKYRQAVEQISEAGESFSVDEAVGLIKKTSFANFDESIGLDLRLGVDPRHADQLVRGTVALPHGTGKEVRVLVLTDESKQSEAEEAGADYVGLDEYVDRIQNDNWTDFDAVIATPNVMSKVGRLGRVLGPRGLMPNPKSGTVTNDVADTIKEVKAGKIEFRVDKFGNLHTSIGKTSFSAEEIADNARTFLKEVLRLRPASAKGIYIRTVTLSSTMGPPISIDRSEAASDAR